MVHCVCVFIYSGEGDRLSTTLVNVLLLRQVKHLQAKYLLYG